MGAVLSFFRPAPVAAGDWSQQEIAEFYRVEAALTQAGLRVTTDRGLSDESDPWFVFCRFDGDVILHFARIDGLYVVDSEAFERPLQGPDFRTLLNAVAAEHPSLVPVPRPNQPGRSGNLILHPAALLAAIVATVAFQLAGGDAMASTLATDGPTEPMHQLGTEGGALPGVSTSHPDPHAQTSQDEAGRLAGEDEGRHARQALVLSAITLISTSLAANEQADITGHILIESAAVSARGSAISAPIVEARQVAPDGRPHQAGNETALDASAVLPVATSGEPVQLWAALTGAASTPAPIGGTNLLRLNVLELGAAGGQELAAMRAAESAPPVTAILIGRVAANAVPVAVEKASAAASSTPAGGSAVAAATPAASGGSASTGSTAPGAPAASSTGSGVVGGMSAALTTAASITASLVVSAAETSSGHGAGTGGGSTASATSQLSAQSQTVALSATASGSEKVSAPTAQPALMTTNLAVRAALSSFIDQYAGSANASTSGDDAASTLKLSGLMLTSLTKLIGTGAASDFMTSFSAYGGSVAASKSGTLALTSDTNPVGSSPSSALVATSTILSAGTFNDKAAPSLLANATSIVDKIDASVTKLVAADATKTGYGGKTVLTDSASGSGSADTASSHTDAATKLAATDVTKTGSSEKSGLINSTTGTDTKDAAASHADTKATAPTTDATAKLATGDVTKTSTGEKSGLTDGATGAGAKDAVASHTDLKTTDGTTGTGAKDAAASHTDVKTADLSTDAATKLAGGTTLDTAALTHTVPVVAPQFLDEQGRQVISRFLETTNQVQTFVSERSFVIIDMDASHFGNPDFTVRTWSIGHDVEISIVGIASDLPPAL